MRGTYLCESQMLTIALIGVNKRAACGGPDLVTSANEYAKSSQPLFIKSYPIV